MDLAETSSGDMGIGFGGGDAGMAEEFLDDAEIGPVFEEVGGEGMSEHVGGHVPFDTCAADPRFDAEPEGDGSEGGAATGEEDVGRGFRGDQAGTSGGEVTFEGGTGGASDGHDPFLVAFADDMDEPGFELELFESDAAEFGEAKAAGVGEFENRVIAEGGFGGLGGRGQDPFDFLGIEGLGELFPATGQREVFRGIKGDEVFGNGEPEEGAEGGDGEVDAGGTEVAGTASSGAGGLGRTGTFLLEEVEEVLEGDFAEGPDAVGGSPGGEAGELGGVGALGVGRLAAFVSDMDQEFLDEWFEHADRRPRSGWDQDAKTRGTGRGRRGMVRSGRMVGDEGVEELELDVDLQGIAALMDDFGEAVEEERRVFLGVIAADGRHETEQV